MTFKSRLIAAGLGASLLTAAAAAIATAQTTQSSDQQASAPHAQATDHITQMIDSCNRMMGHTS